MGAVRTVTLSEDRNLHILHLEVQEKGLLLCRYATSVDSIDQGPLDYTGLERLIGTQAIYVGQSKAAGTCQPSEILECLEVARTLVINLGSSRETWMGNLCG